LNLGARVTVEAIDGQWAVRVYQRAVYFFESELEANRRMPDIEREVREHYSAAGVDFDTAREVVEAGDGGELVISRPRKARADYHDSKQASPEFTREVQHLLKEGKLDPEVGAALERLAAEALPEHSYRQALLPRQNVLGASKHMLRAYAHRFQGAAHHYAVVEHGRAINKNWADAWRVVTKGGYEQGADALNVLRRNQEAVAERMKPTPGNRAMNFITDLSSLISLGFSPAYVLTNATQPWTV
ncbi:hypothetical protein LPQ06_28380, partial [Klebsiella pneumoniae]|nr:hypothetical protein [Klebsiella pneumoniae]